MGANYQLWQLQSIPGLRKASFPPCCYGSVLWLLFSINCKCHRIWTQIVQASIFSSIKILNRLSAIKAFAVLWLCQLHCIPACSQRAPAFSRIYHGRLNIRLYNTCSQTARSLPCIRHKFEHVNISVDGGAIKVMASSPFLSGLKYLNSVSRMDCHGNLSRHHSQERMSPTDLVNIFVF